MFADFLRLGAEHIVTGPDHLLFLLVVVAAARGVRQLTLTLTCFTAGHALTLGACILGGWSLPAAIVEPAIGATIVCLAVFDWWSRHRVPVLPQALRLALVFGCALIHGLGFSNSLLALGVDSQHVPWSLVHQRPKGARECLITSMQKTVGSLSSSTSAGRWKRRITSTSFPYVRRRTVGDGRRAKMGLPTAPR